MSYLFFEKCKKIEITQKVTCFWLFIKENAIFASEFRGVAQPG